MLQQPGSRKCQKTVRAGSRELSRWAPRCLFRERHPITEPPTKKLPDSRGVEVSNIRGGNGSLSRLNGPPSSHPISSVAGSRRPSRVQALRLTPAAACIRKRIPTRGEVPVQAEGFAIARKAILGSSLKWPHFKPSSPPRGYGTSCARQATK